MSDVTAVPYERGEIFRLRLKIKEITRSGYITAAVLDHDGREMDNPDFTIGVEIHFMPRCAWKERLGIEFATAHVGEPQVAAAGESDPAEIEAETIEREQRRMAAALRKFAPDLADELARRWKAAVSVEDFIGYADAGGILRRRGPE
jgi:hypothetical protein